MVIRADQPVTCPQVIGRASELAFLDRVLRDGMRGVGQVVLLSGEAGIGKTRLIATAKASASQAGYVVLESSCFEPDRMVPYGPLIDLFRELLLDPGSTAVAQALDSAAPGLVGMVPELSVRLPSFTRMLRIFDLPMSPSTCDSRSEPTPINLLAGASPVSSDIYASRSPVIQIAAGPHLILGFTRRAAFLCEKRRVANLLPKIMPTAPADGSIEYGVKPLKTSRRHEQRSRNE